MYLNSLFYQRMYNNAKLSQGRAWEKKSLILIVNINNYLQLCVTTTYIYKDTSHFSEKAACETACAYLNRYFLFLLLNIYDGTVVFSDSINAILQRHWWIRNCSLSHPAEEGDFLLIRWVGLPWKAWVGDFIIFILKWIEHAEVIMLSVMWFCDGTYSVIIILIFLYNYKWQASEAHNHFSLAFAIIAAVLMEED